MFCEVGCCCCCCFYFFRGVGFWGCCVGMIFGEALVDHENWRFTKKKKINYGEGGIDHMWLVRASLPVPAVKCHVLICI